MTPCPHTSWIELIGDSKDPFISYGFRLYNLVNKLPDPSAKPRIVFFMGNQFKEKVVPHLCRGESNQQSGQSIDLHLAYSSHCEGPIFFADCDPKDWMQSPHAVDHPPTCHRQETIRVNWFTGGGKHYAPYDLVIARLVFLFTDIICIFVDDLGGLRAVHDMLSKWVKIGSSSGSDLGYDYKPSVIVALDHELHRSTDSMLEEEKFLSDIANVSRFHTRKPFGELTICHVRSTEPLETGMWVQLEKVIMVKLQSVRKEREEKSMLFSATHLNAFFEQALQQINTILEGAFDYIQISRLHNPVDGAIAFHISEFLTLADKLGLDNEKTALFIASAILMDAYPPGMHGEPLSQLTSVFQDN